MNKKQETNHYLLEKDFTEKLEKEFSELWNNVKDGKIANIKLKSGKLSQKMTVGKRKTTIIFLKQNGDKGDVVTLDSLMKLCYKKQIFTIEKLKTVSSTDRSVVQTNTSIRWAVLYYILSQIDDASNDIEFGDEDISKGYWEGDVKTIRVNIYERTRKYKNEFLNSGKACICSICSFNFEKVYGKRGKNFIHLHHLVPLHEIKQGHEVKSDELIPVCPNCHAMLHRGKELLSPDDLKKKMKEVKSLKNSQNDMS
ncbi:MAG: HNH endonuclease [Bacteroidaceae bacterium]|nr:HNH endonuclease [Bacteroidaceae bacterium]